MIPFSAFCYVKLYSAAFYAWSAPNASGANQFNENQTWFEMNFNRTRGNYCYSPISYCIFHGSRFDDLLMHSSFDEPRNRVVGSAWWIEWNHWNNMHDARNNAFVTEIVVPSLNHLKIQFYTYREFFEIFCFSLLAMNRSLISLM